MTLNMQASPGRKELRVVKPGRLTTPKTSDNVKTDFAAFKEIFAKTSSIRLALLDGMEEKKKRREEEKFTRKQKTSAANFFGITRDAKPFAARIPTSNHCVSGRILSPVPDRRLLKMCYHV